MASGFGPRSFLSDREILTVNDFPIIDARIIDHFTVYQTFQFRPSGRRLALWHPDLNDPAFPLDMPAKFVVNEGLPRDILEEAPDEDGITGTER